MNLYQKIAIAAITAFELTACSQNLTPQDIAQLVREKGTPPTGFDNHLVPNAYSLTKNISDGVYQHTLNIQLRDCITKNQDGKINGRMKIRLTPNLDYEKTHLRFGYEITDWGCDGMNDTMDDFRMYLGNDRWHHARPQTYTFDPLFEPVSTVAVKPMYDELIKILYSELKK